MNWNAVNGKSGSLSYDKGDNDQDPFTKDEEEQEQKLQPARDHQVRYDTTYYHKSVSQFETSKTDSLYDKVESLPTLVHSNEQLTPPAGGKSFDCNNVSESPPSIRRKSLLKTRKQKVSLGALQRRLDSLVIGHDVEKGQERILVPMTDKMVDQVHTVDQILAPHVTRAKVQHAGVIKQQRGHVPTNSQDSQTASTLKYDHVTFASRKAPRRANMRELIEKLDCELDERGARNEGFCPTRRQIYNDLFDEILRQVTLDSEDRGLLLWRVREESENSINTLQQSLAAAEHSSESRLYTIDMENKHLAKTIKDLEKDIGELEQRKRLLQQSQENTYEESKCHRESVKDVHDKQQTEQKSLNSQHNNICISYQEYVGPKGTYMRLKDLSLLHSDDTSAYKSKKGGSVGAATSYTNTNANTNTNTRTNVNTIGTFTTNTDSYNDVNRPNIPKVDTT